MTSAHVPWQSLTLDRRASRIPGLSHFHSLPITVDTFLPLQWLLTHWGHARHVGEHMFRPSTVNIVRKITPED